PTHNLLRFSGPVKHDVAWLDLAQKLVARGLVAAAVERRRFQVHAEITAIRDLHPIAFSEILVPPTVQTSTPLGYSAPWRSLSRIAQPAAIHPHLRRAGVP